MSTDLELSSGSPPASLSESQKLARALKAPDSDRGPPQAANDQSLLKPVLQCEREARTEGSAGRNLHSKGHASSRGALSGSGSAGFAGPPLPPSLGAAGRSSSPSDVSKIAFVEFLLWVHKSSRPGG